MTEMLPEIKHGTPGGAQQHYLRGERPCDACRIANREYTRQWRREKRGYADKIIYRVGWTGGLFQEEMVDDVRYSAIFDTKEEAISDLMSWFPTMLPIESQPIAWLEEAPPPRWMTH